MLGRPKSLAEAIEGCVVIVLSMNVAHARGQRRERGGIEPVFVLLQACARVRTQLVEVPSGPRDSDDGHVEVPMTDQ